MTNQVAPDSSEGEFTEKHEVAFDEETGFNGINQRHENARAQRVSHHNSGPTTNEKAATQPGIDNKSDRSFYNQLASAEARNGTNSATASRGFIATNEEGSNQ